MASSTPVGNMNVYVLLISFSYWSVSTFYPSSAIFYSDLPEHQLWPDIWSLRITILFSSNVILILNLSSLLFCVSGIMTVSETVSPYDAFGYSLTLSGTIISILNCYSNIPHTTEWLLLIIEILYFSGTAMETWWCMLPLIQGRWILSPVVCLPQREFCR